MSFFESMLLNYAIAMLQNGINRGQIRKETLLTRKHVDKKSTWRKEFGGMIWRPES